MLEQAVIGAPRATWVGHRHLLFKNAAESVGKERRTSSSYIIGPGAQWQTKDLQLLGGAVDRKIDR
jgi:hypothetical protein